MGMPAPSLAALYDFESQFEQAAQARLTESGIASFITAQGETLPLIHTGISFDTGAALDSLTFLPRATDADPHRQEYCRFTGNLAFEISVNRDTGRDATESGVNQFLGQCRGLIRAAFLRSLWPFNDANLPFLRVSDIRPTGTTTGFNAVRNTDTVILNFTVTFGIQPGAWPVGFPGS